MLNCPLENSSDHFFFCGGKDSPLTLPTVHLLTGFKSLMQGDDQGFTEENTEVCVFKGEYHLQTWCGFFPTRAGQNSFVASEGKNGC